MTTGSAELVPVRDVTATAAAAADADDEPPASSEAQLSKTATEFSKTAQHHGSMTFIVDFGGGGSAGGRDGPAGGGSGSTSRNHAGTALSDWLPARLRRRKSVQSRIDREDQDDDHDATEVLHNVT